MFLQNSETPIHASTTDGGHVCVETAGGKMRLHCAAPAVLSDCSVCWATAAITPPTPFLTHAALGRCIYHEQNT